MKPTPIAAAFAALALMIAGLALSAPKNKTGDIIWTAPDFADRGVQSIAFLPAASFNNDFKSEKTVEMQFSAALRPAGYRWIAPLACKEMLRASMGESTLAVIDKDILKNARIDSLAAGRVCKQLHSHALMSTRVDLFEQVQVQWDQSGKPSTTIQVHAALVDSSGRLLWSGSGSETAEGPYHDPNAATLGVKGSGLTNEPVTGQGGAPSYEEVCLRLFTRWAGRFPAKAVPSPSPEAKP